MCVYQSMILAQYNARTKNEKREKKRKREKEKEKKSHILSAVFSIGTGKHLERRFLQRKENSFFLSLFF